jgi:hypothetical protein
MIFLLNYILLKLFARGLLPKGDVIIFINYYKLILKHILQFQECCLG